MGRAGGKLDIVGAGGFLKGKVWSGQNVCGQADGRETKFFLKKGCTPVRRLLHYCSYVLHFTLPLRSASRTRSAH